MPNYASDVALVFVLTLSYYAAAFSVINYTRHYLKCDPLLIPAVSVVWVIVVVIATSILSSEIEDPASGLFTTKGFYSAGWNTNLNVFRVRIDTWWRYEIVVLYQVTRAILGSLTSNFFTSFLTVEVQVRRTTRTRRDTAKIMAAQACANIFEYFSALTDLFIAFAQVDLSIVMLVTTMVTDGLSTVYFCADTTCVDAEDCKKEYTVGARDMRI